MLKIYGSSQMPCGLAERAIMFSTCENGIVLDPFIGSGTTAVTAYRLNRRFVGIELEQKFCNLSEKRIAEEKQQGRLPFMGVSNDKL